MSPKELYRVFPCERNDVKDFIEKYHYSQSINGVNSKYCFKLVDIHDNIIGAMIYGDITMQGVWKKYVSTKNDMLELRRLCCINDTPKNTESYFIGKTLKYLINNTNVLKIISYADENHNHSGIIYKASNFRYIGKTAKARLIRYGGKFYHDKTIRTYYTNKFGEKVLKPYSQKIKNALSDGSTEYVDSLYKHIFVYDIASHRKKSSKSKISN